MLKKLALHLAAQPGPLGPVRAKMSNSSRDVEFECQISSRCVSVPISSGNMIFCFAFLAVNWCVHSFLVINKIDLWDSLTYASHGIRIFLSVFRSSLLGPFTIRAAIFGVNQPITEASQRQELILKCLRFHRWPNGDGWRRKGEMLGRMQSNLSRSSCNNELYEVVLKWTDRGLF